ASMNSDAIPGNYLMIAVTDSGEGIPPHLLGKVFDPFFTTKDVGKGSGLGLSMVYGFVKQSDGHVKIYSEPGHGTTVKLYLPPATGYAHSGTPPVAVAPIEGGHETILVVEDDALVRSYVVNQIESLGYVALAAPNAAEALAILDKTETVDLLFTDVIMPGLMNGPQLAVEARKRR